MPAPKITLTVGLPGSGKSTWLAARRANAISSDDLRRLLADDPADQSIHAVVFAALRYLVRRRLDIGRPETYIDATNLTRKDRRQFIRIARDHRCAIEGVFFDTPLEICLQRNRTRERVVPDDAIRTMAAKLQPPTTEEGFSRIHIVTG